MSPDFYTYILILALMLHKADIITKKQLKKLVDVSRDNAEKGLEELIDELWEVASSSDGE